jgi:WD40 repeat protein
MTHTFESSRIFAFEKTATRLWCLPMLGVLTALLVPTLSVVAQEGDDEEEAGTGPWISSVAWPEGDQLVATKSQGLLLRPAEIVRADATKPKQLDSLADAETSLWSVLNVGGNRCAVSDYQGQVWLYDGEQLQPFEMDARWIRALAATPQEDHILAGTEDGKLVRLSLDERNEIDRVDAHDGAIFDIAFDPAGEMLATAGGDGTIRLFSWPDLEPQGQLSRGEEAVWSVLFTPDGKQLVSGGADRRVQLWDVTEKKSLVSMASTSDWVTDLVHLPETNLIVAGLMNGNLAIVDFATMQTVATAEGPGSAVWSLALSPDHTRIALGTRKDGLSVMEVAEWIEAGQQAASEAAKIRPPKPEA